MIRVLVAGASGSIGFRALRLAHEAGCWVRTLSHRHWQAAKVSLFANDLWLRDATCRESLRGICHGVDVVLSCMGASTRMQEEDPQSFYQVNYKANLNLLEEAQRAGVSRFVYLSVYANRRFENTAYVRAHRRFERALLDSGMESTVLRVTETYSRFDHLVRMAQRGSVPLIGRGEARINAIHPEDVARLCIAQLQTGLQVVEAGGPELLSRRQIVEQIFQQVGEDPDLYQIPAFILRLTGNLTRPFNPRKANLLEFLPAASKSDVVAPPVGALRWADYLRETTQSPAAFDAAA